jgi:SAM-dependent methyltransferase
VKQQAIAILRRARSRFSPGASAFLRTRRHLAERYLVGEGIEIGALHMPLPVPEGARVRYVDRLDLTGLRTHYSELAGESLVAPAVIDDGEHLSTLPEASEDFIVANHFIEHCEDPLGTLAAHARVLRPGGILYMAVPDARRGIDVARTRTSWEHVLRDHLAGPESSRSAHYREWASLVDVRLGNITRGQIDEHARSLCAERYSIHFHAWEPGAFLDMVASAREELGLPLEVVEAVENHHELIVILRRFPSTRATAAIQGA